MNKTNEVLLILAGVLVVGAVIYIVEKNSATSTRGIVFGQANPQSVASLYTAQAADSAAAQTTTQQRIQAQSNALSALLGYYANVNNNSTAATMNTTNQSAATAIAGLQTAQAEYAAGQQTAQTAATTNAATTLGVAQSNNNAQTAQYIAGQSANAQIQSSYYNTVAVSNQASAAKDAAQSASGNSLWSNIAGDVIAGISLFA